jgi:ATP-binding cassette subfamily B protein
MGVMNNTALRHVLRTYGRSPGVWFAFGAEVVRAFLGRVVTVLLLAGMVAAVAEGNFDRAKELVIIWAAITLFTTVLSVFGELAGVRGENRTYGNLMLSYYEKLTGKDMTYFRDTHTGYVAAQVRQYVDAGLLLTRQLRGEILRMFISLVFPVVVLFVLYWPIGLVAFVLVVTQGLYVFWSSAKANVWRRRSNELYRKISGVIADDVTNIVAFKSAGQEKTAQKKLADLRSQELKAFLMRRKTVVLLDFPRNVVVTILTGTAFLLALSSDAGQAQTIAVLVATTTYFFQMLRTSSELPQVIYMFDEHVTKMEATLDTLTNEHEKIRDPADPILFQPKHGAVSIDNITFNYKEDGSSTQVFRNLSLSIAGGEKIGIVGMSGAGKSTLASLLMRFDDVQSGSIRIDDIDIRDVAQSELRRHIAYVPQEPLLFHQSIRDNIAYHNHDASEQDIIRAAKAAHAHEFIDKLAKKYETIVGERGVKLSGGQKQRVVIARAILKKAPIILFDEATSALDSESEHIIQSALPNIIGNHTAIVIAHRLSTVANLDRIIVMHEGKIVEEGTHKQLLRTKGRYYSLWQRQISETIDETRILEP